MKLPFRKKGNTTSVTPKRQGGTIIKKIGGKKYRGPGTFKRMMLNLEYFGLGQYRSEFIQNLSMMLGAALLVTDALATLAKEAPKKPMRKLLGKIHTNVENGSSLWRAMDQMAFFTPYSISLIRIGEESGNLADNLTDLAVQDEKDQAMRGKVKMAMVYPTIVIVLTIIIFVGLAWFILPQLVGVLTALNVELPLVTIWVIAVADFFTAHGIVVVPSVTAGFVVFALLSKYTKLKIVRLS